ncbi:hypothetical protein EJ998_31645 [Burkholderia cepacia ATCC 25416]|nr:hypothetical protein EJ998_31645 [Burkholderia cepacia ATCC 25416]
MRERAGRQHGRGKRGNLRRLHGSVPPCWTRGSRCAGCAPTCIVGVKVTSHIGREKTGGDLFLTVCDYEWKPLGFLRSLLDGVLARIAGEFSLSTCGAPLGAPPGRNGAPVRLLARHAHAAPTNGCHGRM